MRKSNSKIFLFLPILILSFAFPITVQGQQTFQFPLQGTDTISVSAYPYWYSIGDYAEGQRTVAGQVGSGTLNLVFTNALSNSCSPNNWVDLNFSINGQVVATHRVNVSDASPASIPFTLPSPISGTFTARIEETNQVCGGAGNIQIADTGASTLELLESQTIAIPTMSQWGMIIFMFFAGVVSVYYLRRQKRANT